MTRVSCPSCHLEHIRRVDNRCPQCRALQPVSAPTTPPATSNVPLRDVWSEVPRARASAGESQIRQACFAIGLLLFMGAMMSATGLLHQFRIEFQTALVLCSLGACIGAFGALWKVLPLWQIVTGGLLLGVGGFVLSFGWISLRGSLYNIEIMIAVLLGAAPGWLLLGHWRRAAFRAARLHEEDGRTTES